jgi:hypothetical protein
MPTARKEERSMNGFLSQRITKDTELIIDAAPQRVFPLLCPVREYDWIEPWQCRVLYTESGVAENNCIFETDFPHNGGRETWVVSSYDKDRGIEFVRFTPEEKVVKLDIRLRGTADGGTRLLWRKTFTGLSLAGNRIVTAMAGDFDAEVERIGKMLNHYLPTGKMMPLAELQ